MNTPQKLDVGWDDLDIDDTKDEEDKNSLTILSSYNITMKQSFIVLCFVVSLFLSFLITLFGPMRHVSYHIHC